MDVGLRLCNVATIDLKLTGSGRGVKLELGGWRKFEADISRGRIQLPIVVGYGFYVEVAGKCRSNECASDAGSIYSSSSAFHDCGGWPNNHQSNVTISRLCGDALRK